MSYSLVQACMDMRGDPLSSTEWRVLLVLCRYAGEDGTCFPTRQTIATAGRLNVRSVIDALHALKEKEWVSWAQPAGKKRIFSILTDKLMDYQVPVQESAPVQKSAPVQESAPGGCRKVHPGGAEKCTRIYQRRSHRRSQRREITASQCSERENQSSGIQTSRARCRAHRVCFQRLDDGTQGKALTAY